MRRFFRVVAHQLQFQLLCFGRLADQPLGPLCGTGEDVGLASVYRVLIQFETAGLVARHHFEGGQSVFEINQGEHHDHILCVGCGKVDEFVDEVIEQRQRAIAKKAGYVMTDHSLYIYGMCGECQKKKM